MVAGLGAVVIFLYFGLMLVVIILELYVLIQIFLICQWSLDLTSSVTTLSELDLKMGSSSSISVGFGVG
jgi:hypothetical protein